MDPNVPINQNPSSIPPVNMNPQSQTQQPSPIKSATVQPSMEEQDSERKRRFLIILALLFLLILIIIILFFLITKFGKKTITTSSSPEFKTMTNSTTSTNTTTIENTQTTSSDNPTIQFQGSQLIQKGEEGKIELLLNPGNKQITGLDLKLDYSSDVLEIVSIEASTGLPVVLKQPEVGTSQAHIILGSSPTRPLSAPEMVATIVVEAKKTGTAQIGLSGESKITAITFRDYINVESMPFSITIN